MTVALVRVMVVVVAVLATAAEARAGKRKAFVAGIDSYDRLPRLTSATSDALMVGRTLEAVGFAVTRVTNGTRRELDEDWRQFLATVADGDFVVVYFAGHGVQKSGVNYLLPSDFGDFDQAAGGPVRLDQWVEELAGRKAAAKVFIVDACRDNRLQSESKGLAGTQNPSYGSGTYIMYATAPGSVAQDGLFAKHLARALAQPGQSIEEVFSATALAVRRESRNGQAPFAINSGGFSNADFTAPDRDGPMTLAEKGQCDQALPLLENLRRDDPTDGPVLLALGRCELAEGHVARARRTLEQAENARGLARHVVLIELGVAALVANDVIDAKLRAQQALKSAPNHPGARILEGRILLRERQYGAAVDVLSNVYQRLERQQSLTASDTRDLRESCTLLAEAFELNGATDVARTQRSACTSIR